MANNLKTYIDSTKVNYDRKSGIFTVYNARIAIKNNARYKFNEL